MNEETIWDILNNGNVFIIAELSANHNGSLDTALETIRAAKRAGADAIKLQTYRADTITIDVDSEEFQTDPESQWAGQSLYQLYEKAYTPWEWHEDLFQTAEEEGLICFSSPFDLTAIDFLENLNTPVYKIASFEITDIPLIEYAASKGKPMIISTGIAEMEDIQLAVDACRRMDNHQIVILKCTSSYPAPVNEANLIMMKDFEKRFGVLSGLSDHTLGITVPVVATALGAKVIEKHFILDKSIGGPDAFFSLDENEFTDMVQAVRVAEQSIGKVNYELTDKQKQGRNGCRSLYVMKDIKKGEFITEKNVKSIRPGYGMHPKFYKDILGKKAVKNLSKGTALKDSLIN